MTCSLLFVIYLQNHYSPSWCQQARPISHIPGSFTGLASFFFFPPSFLLCWVPTMGGCCFRHQEHSGQQSRQKSTSSWRSHPDPNGGRLQIGSERASYDGDKQSREGDWECSGHGGTVLNRVAWKDLFWVGRISPETYRRRGSQVCACLEEEYL